MTTRCPHCGGEILPNAKKCKHCKKWLPPTDEILRIRQIDGEIAAIRRVRERDGVDLATAKRYVQELGDSPAAAISEEGTKQCRFCGKEIAASAKKCKHCKRWLEYTPEQRNADIARYAAEWAEQRFSLLPRIPLLLKEEREVAVGARHPDFEDWILQNLGDGEKIVIRCYSGDESLVVTSDKVILLKKGAAKAAVASSGVGTAVGALSNSWIGLAAGMVADYAIGAQGVIAKSVDFYNITSVDCTKGAMFGHIEISFPGAKETKTGGFVQNAISENVFQFAIEDYDFIVVIANEIRRRIKAARQPQQILIPQQSATESIPDQIKKLAGLFADGILTEDEFRTKKTELLARM